ncbi:MAG: thiamine pyrophosphate-requiring protein [Oscillospiraceae bacterium]|nr:thiamine pyrophosphate-requiring protein [Oscillospiraceae bacterium]
MKDNTTTYCAADALNDALVNAGVQCVFVNSGTDYPPIIESWAKCEAEGRKMPKVIISPHEYVALSAAQGYAQITGKAQAVFVHVDVGTQNLGGAMHNAFRCRTPVFVFAGLSPHTIEGEYDGGRNHYIQFIQNAADQEGIVRGYTKFNYEFRSSKNIQQMTYRALQLAQSEPMGPVYLTAGREVLQRDSMDIGTDINLWNPIAPAALDDESVTTIIGALSKAKKPLIITAYSGRNPNCVGELEKFAEKLAIPVLEVNEQACMNFPGSNPLHCGFDVSGFIEHADVALLIDCDLPWIPAYTKPKAGCRIFSIDIDPLKNDIPLWYLKAERFMKADSYTAIRQLHMEFDRHPFLMDKSLVEKRRERLHGIHKTQRASWEYKGKDEEHITPEYLTVCIREVIDDDTVVLNETISVRTIVDQLLPRNKPGTLFGNGGSSLGWFGGAAVGMKLACPEKDIVALTGDGTFIFSCPTAVYWMAAKYETPFMTVIYNNQGWNAPKKITSQLYPEGFAASSNEFYASLAPSAQLDMVAQAAGGAFAKTVTDPKELLAVLKEGRQAVKDGKCAVINVMLKPI